MDNREITLIRNGAQEKATVFYDTEQPSIIFKFKNFEKICHGENLFSCFIKLRQELPEIKFLCKGAKRNVHPSRMSSQMSAGLMAYKLETGKQARRENLVNIFDYEEESLTNEPTTQSEYYKNWLESLR
ncbi:hypothetical protein [Pseudomonas viridiflava]|uniref:hypothetical protein n=1 Tax=Pseudomonas viridiflava TaxID=33069 RepID=UPI000F040F1D|nr:hypothetical protein [Pseudomonas viridiflava]